MDWYCRLNGIEMGPFPLDRLREMLAAGLLQADGQVRSGNADWQSASSVEELFPSGDSIDSIDELGIVIESDTSVSHSKASNEWFTRVKGVEVGPLGFEQVFDMARNGVLERSSEVRLSRTGEWQLAESIEGLFGETTVATEETGASVHDSIDELGIVIESDSMVRKKAESNDWFAEVRGVSMGPVGFDQLFQMAQNDVLSRSDRVRHGTDEWELAESIVGLFGQEEEKEGTSSEKTAESKSAAGAATGTQTVTGTKPKKSADTWHVRVKGVEMGPMPRAQVKQMQEAGILADDDEIRVGSGAWKKAGSWNPDRNGGKKSEVSVSDTAEMKLAGSDTSVMRAQQAEADQWFCEIRGSEYGPISWTELLAWVKDNRILPEHRVRKGQEGVYEPAVAIEGLFPGHPMSPGGSSRRTPMPPVLLDEAPEPSRTPPPVNTPTAPRAWSSLAGGSGPSQPASTPMASPPPTKAEKKSKPKMKKSDRAASSFSFSLSSLFAGGDNRNAMIGGGVLAFLLLAYGAWTFMGDGVDDHAAYAELLEIAQECDRLVSSNSDLTPLVTREQQRVSRLAKTLEKNATAQNPARIALLRAARDDFNQIASDDGAMMFLIDVCSAANELGIEAPSFSTTKELDAQVNVEPPKM